MMKKFSPYFLFFCAGFLKAQLPNTELWLFKMENKKGILSFTKPTNITNRDGYDNQPSFSRDNKKLYYVSIREDKQADIYYYDLRNKKTVQFTKTPVSEYSPAETPDRKFVSAVVVEHDSAQRIHLISQLTGIHEKSFEYDSVGYCTFLNNDTCVYYKLTQPHSLRFNTGDGKEDKWLGMSPARTFKPVNRSTLVYGLKDSASISFYKYDFILHRAQKYAVYPSLNEDIVWHPKLGLVKSEGAELLRFDEHLKTWVLLVNLSGSGIKKITRFDFDSEDKYLVVTDNL